jgi:hypothetical protein
MRRGVSVIVGPARVGFATSSKHLLYWKMKTTVRVGVILDEREGSLADFNLGRSHVTKTKR